ncbi:hypothetical protein H0H92_003047 [Tricholoma furcatifolium]|nr:hypothetical protein H0H92_003047 [Tricholoma furcatifolium]
MDAFILYTDLDGWIESSIPTFIIVQLYLRSNQLDTADRLARRLPDVFDPCCRMGRATIETEHHIFVTCPSFTSLRNEATKQLVSQTITILDIFCILTSSLVKANLSSDKLERLRSRLAKTWHAIFVRLAGRIWGMVRRLSRTSSSPELPKVPMENRP